MLINESNVLFDCKASSKSSRESGFILNPLNLCQSSNNANIIAKTKNNKVTHHDGSHLMSFKLSNLVDVPCAISVEIPLFSIHPRWKSLSNNLS